MTPDIVGLIGRALWETTYMVAISSVMAAIIGLPLGIILVVTRTGHILESRLINLVLGFIVNAARSVPFIILMVAIIPLTRFIVGSSIGTKAAIVPLTLAAAPFVARLAETAMIEISWGIIEAAQAAGATPWQIIWKVILPETKGGLVLVMAITVINLIGYSAMAGAIGGGGLGDLCIRYGYQRFRPDIMIITVVILIIIVQLLQILGDSLNRRLSRR